MKKSTASVVRHLMADLDKAKNLLDAIYCDEGVHHYWREKIAKYLGYDE